MFEIDAQQTGVLQFAVWADEGVETMHVASFMVDWKLGTPACERFVTCPPILGPFMNEVHGLARDWLTECQSLHEACASTNQTKLPTRVLQIFGGSQTPAVKLIETKGASEGKYCALSHCWGPANKQPLRTTHENYQSHLGGINLEELPKSFRDAIMLTRGLDIEYLWIDSLCIVQDDEEDWRYEAGEMAGVYQNATLVIAAADAKDSTEGFFISERRHESTRKVPYIKKGVMEGSFNIARLPTYDSGPSESHLNTRAWAFQERLLARRIIFFARGGISWKCSKLETRERSSGEDLGFYESQSWLHLLEQYSRKRMTNAGDRLHALRGITLEMQKTRTDHFNPVYGIWEARIYAQLLWRRNKTLIEAEVLDLPTWTWAATGGAKIWCDPDMEQGTLQAMPKVLDLSASGALVSSAYCSRRPLALRYLATGDWTSSFHPDSYSDGFLEKYMLPGGWGREDYPVYAIEAVSSGTRILGISVFDREPSTSATCFFVARHERHRVSDIDEVSYASRSHREREGIDSECAHDGEGYHEGSPSSNDGWDPDCATEANPNSSEADEPYATIKTTIGKGNGSRLRKFIQHTMSSDAMDSMDPEDVAIVSTTSLIYARRSKSNLLR
jgi:hypothetical protein